MAYFCVFNGKKECDGCMECQEQKNEMEENNIPDYVYDEKSWRSENNDV